MSSLSRGGGRLTQALDRDVLAVVQRFIDDAASPLPQPGDVYNHIMRSNSALKRRTRKQLEGSIERVLDVLQEDRRGGEDDDDDDSDTMDAIEGDFADIGGPKQTKPLVTADRGLNKGLTRLWAANPNPTVSKDAANGAHAGQTTSQKQLDSTTSGNSNGNGTSTEVPRRPTRAHEPPVKRRKIGETDRSPPDYSSFSHLGGIKAVRDQLEDLLALPLLRPDIYENAAFQPPRGILLHGPPGCGKTAVAHAIAAAMKVPFIPISGPSIVSGMSGESEKALRDHFEEARKLAPCIIFIDEIDAITPKRESAQRQMETRIVAQLLTCMDDLLIQKTGGRPIIVIAATNRPDSLDPALRRGGRFGSEINMPVPDEPTRLSILETITRPLPLDGNLNLEHLAKRTAGFVGADLRDLVDRSAQMALRRFRSTIENENLEMQTSEGDENTGAVTVDSKMRSFYELEVDNFFRRLEKIRASRNTPSDIKVSQADFETALPLIQPSSKREGFATVPDTSWRNIGALSAVREELMVSIVQPILKPDVYRKVGITIPAGVLLWGPPGCGKTLLAKAVANESMANFISVKGPELMNKYVGESEREVRLLFTRARSSVPCIIFFDELDALAPRRGSEMTESSTRVVNTLLTEMDGINKREGIYIIGATNRPDLIEPAMLRPGRLETPLFVDLPGAEERVEILSTQCRNAGNDFGPQIADIARGCERFSGADLQGLRHRAAREAVKRGGEAIELEDWQKAAKSVKPSVDARAEKSFKRLLRTFGNAVIDDQGAEEGNERQEGAETSTSVA